MKRSRAVPLIVVPILSAALSACGDDHDRYAYCVDRDNRVVDQRYCGDDQHGGGPGYFWYMTDSNHYQNAVIHNGSHLPLTGSSGARGFQQGPRVVSTNKTVVRTRVGGFGSTSRTTTSSSGRAVSGGS